MKLTMQIEGSESFSLYSFWTQVVLAYANSHAVSMLAYAEKSGQIGVPQRFSQSWATMYSAVTASLHIDDRDPFRLLIQFNGRRHSIVASPVMHALFGGAQFLADHGRVTMHTHIETQDPSLDWCRSSSCPTGKIYETTPESPTLLTSGLAKELWQEFGLYKGR